MNPKLPLSKWWLQYSTRTLLLVMMAIALWLGYRASLTPRRDRTREYVRLIAAYELSQVHGRIWGADQVHQSQSLFEELNAGLLEETTNQNWAFRLFPADEKGADLDASSRAALAQL